MIKRTAILVAILVLASSAFGQYLTDYATGMTDIRGSMATTAPWKALPPKTFISVAGASDGQIFGLDTSGCGWFYDWQARTYTQQTVWGCGWSEIGVLSNFSTADSTTLGLLKTDATCPSGTKRWYYSHNGGTPAMQTVCVQHWYGGYSSWLAIGWNGTTTKLFNGVNTYDLGSNWLGGSIYNENTACLFRNDIVNSKNIAQVYLFTKDNSVALFSPQPPFPDPGHGFGGATGCVINDDGVFMVTDATKNYWFDFDSNTWTTITGAKSDQVFGPSAAAMLGLRSGNLYHLNVFAGFISGTTSGHVNTCPTAPCDPSATHTGTIQITVSHLLPGTGTLGSQTVPAANQLSVSSLAVAPNCDLIFGDPNDPECNTSAGGQVHCNVSGFNFAGGASGKQPPRIGSGGIWSMAIRSWDHTSELYDTRQVDLSRRTGRARWGSTVDSCAPNTTPSCPAVDITPEKKVVCITTDPIGKPCTDVDLQAKVDLYGFDHSLNKIPPSAWLMIDQYQLVNGNKVCFGLPAIKVWDGKAFGTCH